MLTKLLDWGEACIDKSLNQPTLPHAILTLNATDNFDDDQLDIVTATRTLMDASASAVYNVPRCKELADKWRSTGRTISRTHELLLCYYASVTVVRVPAKGRYMLIEEQAIKLDDLISRRCDESNIKKQRLRILPTADKLQVYLQAAFDHFTENLDKPFDFFKESLKHDNIPRDFGGRILKLALMVKEHSSHPTLRTNAREIFMLIAPMVASCITLATARQNLFGTCSAPFCTVASLITRVGRY